MKITTQEVEIDSTTKVFIDWDESELHIETSRPQFDMTIAKVIAERLGEFVPIVFEGIHKPVLAGKFITGSGWKWSKHSNRYLEQSCIQRITK